MTKEIQNQGKKRGRKPNPENAEANAPEITNAQQEHPTGRTVNVTIRSMPQGDSEVYATSGFHLASEHKRFLPEGRKKILPGDVVELPAEIAKRYLASRVLEIVG